jgi:hypothetical protein
MKFEKYIKESLIKPIGKNSKIEKIEDKIIIYYSNKKVAEINNNKINIIDKENFPKIMNDIVDKL